MVENSLPEGLSGHLDVDSMLALAEAQTLSGDIRDVLLTHVRDIKVPWTMLAESEQQAKIDAIDATAKMSVRRALGIMAQEGMPFVVVGLNKWTVKDGVKVEIHTSATVENIAKLAEHGAKPAILVLADPDVYVGERAPARAGKDQPDLPMIDDED